LPTSRYDAEGNRIRRTHLASGAVTEYTWDARNRLVTVTQRATAEGPATQVGAFPFLWALSRLDKPS